MSDFSESFELQRRLSEHADALTAMADDMGLAKQVREFSGDRRKTALARAMAAPLAGGDSVAKAEAEGRASELYNKELKQLANEMTTAEQVIARWEALRIQWESARSLISMQKSQMNQL